MKKLAKSGWTSGSATSNESSSADRLMKKFFSQAIHTINLEAVVWLGGLLALALMNPDSTQHYSLCIFKNLGFNFCPGCGLGHSISYFLHGDLVGSLQAHPLGAVATIILISRTISLLRMSLAKGSGAIVNSKMRRDFHG